MADSTAIKSGQHIEVAANSPAPLQQPMRALFDRAAADFADRPAYRFEGRVTSYRELHKRVDEATAVLRRLGAGPGVRIALLLPNSPAIAIYTFAAFGLGATIVPLDPDAPDAELSATVKACGALLLVTCDTTAMTGKAVTLTARGGLGPVVVVSFTAMLPVTTAARMRMFSPGKLARAPLGFVCPAFIERELLREKTVETVLASTEATPRPALLDDVAIATHTAAGDVSRSTLLTHANLANNLAQVCEGLPVLRLGEERIVAALPLWHPIAQALAINLAIAVGAELVIAPDMTAKGLVETVRLAPPTVLIAPAPLIGELMASPDVGALQLGGLRFCLAAGGMVTAAVRAGLAAVSNAPLLDCFGLSIAPTIIAINRPEDAGMLSNGYALSGTRIVVRDFADLSREVPRGERGELCVSGPQVAGPEQITPNTGLFIGGDLRTGDLGLIDAEGRLFVVDRVDDLIVAAGYLIYPRRIEAALLEHPAIVDAAVIGVGDGKRGNAPKAFVIARRGVAITERDLRLFLATRISRIEMPADIDFCTVLPRTAFGLICKARLREAEAARRG